jgi:hypothetical protein
VEDGGVDRNEEWWCLYAVMPYRYPPGTSDVLHIQPGEAAGSALLYYGDLAGRVPVHPLYRWSVASVTCENTAAPGYSGAERGCILTGDASYRLPTRIAGRGAGKLERSLFDKSSAPLP